MVAARRDVLRMAASFAAASGFAPRPAAAQTFTFNSISQAAQDARRDVGALGRRADDLLRQTVADGPEHSARAVRRFRVEHAALARDLAAIFNGRVGEDDWLLVSPMRELDLALTIRPLVIRLAPTLEEVEISIKQTLPQIEPLRGDSADDVLLTIALDSLGLERRVALFEQLRNDGALAAALKDAAAGVEAQRDGLSALELERLMRIMVRPGTVDAIAENLGPDSRRTLYKALTVRFVPFVGWTYFVTLLLVTIYYNRDTTAPILARR
ncbi:MAG: hypothetical protein ACR2K5_15820 [Pseudolabrys sp.]